VWNIDHTCWGSTFVIVDFDCECKPKCKRAIKVLPYSKDDAEFMAHTRTDIPALVAEVEMLREALIEAADIIIEDLRNQIKSIDKTMHDYGFDFGLPETEL